MKLGVKVKKLYADAQLPNFATAGSAGGDLYAYIPEGSITVHEGETVLVKTGIAVEVPPNFELQVRARSGLALKNGLMVANGIGTVDSDYRGEVGVILYNAPSRKGIVDVIEDVLARFGLSSGSFLRPFKPKSDRNAFIINHGDRIAQAVFARHETPHFYIVDELSDTDRGAGGYGHSGTK